MEETVRKVPARETYEESPETLAPAMSGYEGEGGQRHEHGALSSDRACGDCRGSTLFQR